MQTNNKILVGVDLKKSTKNLLNYAFALSEHTGKSMVVLHVVDYDDKYKNSEDSQKANMANAKLLAKKVNVMESIVESIPYKNTVDYKIVAKAGYIHKQIIRCSEEENVELILLGTHLDIKYFSFESTIDEVISLSKKPVLIVPDKVEFHPFQNKLYSTDFLYEDSKFIDFMQSLQGNLTCLHIQRNEDDLDTSNKKMEILKSVFKNNDVQFVIQKGKVTSAILEYALQIKADLVGLTHKQKDLWNYFFQSNTCKVFVKKSKIPTIIFHEL